MMPFAGAARKRPTRKHRPAVWEAMLATVYARNAAGVTRYFDYDWDAARAFAGVDQATDLRLYRAAQSERHIRKGQLVLYVKDAS